MKKVWLIILMQSYTALMGQSLPLKVHQWLDQQRQWNEQNTYSRLEDHQYYDTLNVGVAAPRTFYDPRTERVLRDSFLIDNPSIPLKVQAMALKNEQVSYGYDWVGVSVAYGMLPFLGSYWEDISLGRWSDEARKYVMNRLIRDRTEQTKLYNWARKVILYAWMTKPDTAQALDMFAVWKASKYLEQYDIARESERAKQASFAHQDWSKRDDTDAKLYAFWHRRISAFMKDHKGCSLEDARHWNKIAVSEMWTNSKPGTKKIFNIWTEQWTAGSLTSVTADMMRAKK
ncbi:MAG: hypothetical protein JST14_10110 [Bacteroidetes bacterium]|nr:hypothetical protein [Bacteroidota bacterium]